MLASFSGFIINEDWAGRQVAIAAADKQNDGTHDLQHQFCVWKLAQRLLAEYPAADALVVQAACYLRGLVNLPQNHVDHTQASKLAARRASDNHRLGRAPLRLSQAINLIELI
jgi:uncharacterized protein